jgi:hypothetical protein
MGRHLFSVLAFNMFDELPRCRFTLQPLQLTASGSVAAQPDLIWLQELVGTRARGDTGWTPCGMLNRNLEIKYQLGYARTDGFGEGDWQIEFGSGLMTRGRPPDFVEVLPYASQVEFEGTISGQRYRVPDDRMATDVQLNLGLMGHLDT